MVESLGGLQEILMLFELKLCADVIVGFPLGSSLVIMMMMMRGMMRVTAVKELKLP